MTTGRLLGSEAYKRVANLFAEYLSGAFVCLSDPLFVGVGLVLDPVQLSVLVVDLVAHVVCHVLQIGHYIGHFVYVLFHFIFSVVLRNPKNN